MRVKKGILWAHIYILYSRHLIVSGKALALVIDLAQLASSLFIQSINRKKGGSILLIFILPENPLCGAFTSLHLDVLQAA